MRVFLAFVLGLIIGSAGLWFYLSANGRSQVRNGEAELGNAARSARDAIGERLRALHLNPDEVKDELARTGQVVRRKAQEAGQTIANAAADTKVTATIKGKLLVNHELASQDISVTTTDGVVTLSGTVGSVDDISRAMALAMETDGVREVVSKLQVRQQTARRS